MSIYCLAFIHFFNILLTTKSRGGYGRHEEETKIKLIEYNKHERTCSVGHNVNRYAESLHLNIDRDQTPNVIW